VENSATQEEKYFRVVEWQGAEGRMCNRSVMLGYAESDDGRLNYIVPDMPDKDVYWVEPWDGKETDPRNVKYHYRPFEGAIRMEVMNSGRERKRQKWDRPPLPDCWTNASLARTCFRMGWTYKKAGKVIPDMEKFRDPENLDTEQYEYATREWHRRVFGVWIWINDTVTYLTGAHYYYLQHFKIDNGYPQYRDRDRRWFYAWQVCLEDAGCLGMVYLKHRRDGATYRCGCIGLETATRGHAVGANFGIMSKDEESAKEAFKTKVVSPFQKMPFFFSPMVKDKTDVEKCLEFKPPPRSASDRWTSDETGLESMIEYKAKGKKGKAGFDSYKLFTLLMDEVGKLENISVLEALRLVFPTMELDGGLGKILAPSTNEELEGDNKEEFRKLWDQSDPAIRLSSENEETTTLMLRYFTPAFDSLNMAYIGPFGESIVHKPTEEQLEHLMTLPPKIVQRHRKNWEQGGAYEYLVRERLNKTDRTGYIRLYPFTPEESFSASNPESDYNIDNCNRLLRMLREPSATGNLLVHDLTVRGNLEWMAEFKGRVKFVPHPQGRFLFNRDYMPGGRLAQKLRIVDDGVVRHPPRPGRDEVHGRVGPGSDSWIVIGTDPQKTAKVDQKQGKRYSKAAAHGFYPYRFEMEGVEWVPQLEVDPDFAEEWITNAFVFEYICHPKNPRQHHEDMLMACIYLNAKILFERQVNEMGQYFREVGAAGPLKPGPVRSTGFLMTDYDWIKKKEEATPGLPSSDDVIDLYKDRTKAYIDYFAWPRLCPFIDTVNQWIDFKRENIERLDGQVSSGYSLLAAQPHIVRKAQKKPDIAPGGGPRQLGIGDIITLYK
jgi:hypothetical protein